MTTPSPSKPASPPPKQAEVGSRLPDRNSLIVVSVCITIVVLLQIFGDQFDFALVNILSLVFSFIALVSLLVWLAFRSSYAPSIRFGMLGIALGLVAIAVSTLKIVSVDGNMIPTLAFRWQASADSELQRLETPAAPPVIEASSEESQFTQFLGPNRNGYLPGPELVTDWTASPPQEIWRLPKLGAGWSGFVVSQGIAVTMEQRGPEEWVTAYRFDNGQPVWGHAIKARHETVLGGVGPRSTPTIDGTNVYALGATGVLRCLELKTGKLIWSIDLLDRQGLTSTEDMNEIAWGRANSPLIIGPKVIVPEGGRRDAPVSIIALDKESGDVLWEAGSKQISYCSPTLMNIAGVDQLVMINEDSVTGHNLADGSTLWTIPWAGSSSANASNSQPHLVDGNKLFLSKGYGQGAALMELSLANNVWKVNIVWENSRVLKTKFTNAVLIDGFAYGLSDGILECVDLTDGHSCWKKGRYGHGQVLGVGKNLLVQTESGPVKLVAANPEKFEELGTLDALTDKSWNNLCLVGNKLLVRSASDAACYQLATVEKPQSEQPATAEKPSDPPSEAAPQ